MRFIICVALNLILFNVNVDSSAILKFFSSPFHRTKHDNKSKFTDLNADCTFLILEHLKFADLLNVAEVNAQFSMVAADVFRLKYSHYQIEVSDDFSQPNDKLNKPYELLSVAGLKIDTDTIGRVLRRIGLQKEIHDEPKLFLYGTSIILDDYNAILNTFKHFGHLITRIKLIYYTYRDFQLNVIGSLISKYSSESLVEFECENCGLKTLASITKPVINVETVTFSESFVGDASGTLSLSDSFPAIRRLNLDLRSGKGFSYFVCQMSHLDYVSLSEIPFTFGTTDDSFENMIMKNPQIRDIDLFDISPEFVPKVVAHLPQLENLTLSHFRLWNGSIEFESVKRFAMDCEYNSGSPKNLHFPNLHTLSIEFNKRQFGEWLDFVTEHNHLKELHLKHAQLSDSQFQQLTANLQNLVDMTLWYLSGRFESVALGINVIVEFVKSHKQLKQFNVINYPKSSRETLQEQLKHEWNTKVIGNGLSFERKMVSVDKWTRNEHFIEV